MNQKFISSIVFLMRSTFIFTICNCLFSAILIASPAFSQKLGETKVTIDFKEKTLNDCIKQIEQKTAIQFAFNPEDLKTESLPSFKFKQISVKEILSVLLENSNLAFEEAGGKIVIFNNPKNIITDLRISEITANEIAKVSLNSTNEIAQQNTITGIIVDAKGETVPAVTVNVKGSTRSSISNQRGEFSIVANENDVLVFSSIGYISKEIQVGLSKTLKVSLESSTTTVDEVVVIGYGTQKRSNLTGAISSLKGETLKNLPVRGIAEALQGRVAGVTVTSEGGDPGGSPNIIIRGPVNIRGAQPLYVIDGIPFTDSGNSFNMQDVESIEIIKDASAAAIYGSQAAGGVILVTTKKGKAGQLLITANSTVGTRRAITLPQLLNRDEFINAKRANGNNMVATFGPESGWGDLPNTNWFNELYRTSLEQNHSLSISGGSDKSTFFMSANYNDQQGIRIDNFVKRYSIRVNSDHKINSKLKVGQTFYLTSENRNPAEFSNQGEVSYRTSPIMNVFDSNNQAGGGWGKTPSYFVGGNEYANEFSRFRRENNYTANLAGYLDLEIIKGLNLRQNVAVKYNGFDNYIFEYPFDVGAQMRTQLDSRMTKHFRKGLDYLANTTLNYNKQLGLHDFSILAGFEARKSNQTDIQGFAYNSNSPLNKDFKFVGIQPIQTNTVEGTGFDYNRFLSVFGRVSYIYDQKYIFMANVRRDGNATTFGPNNKYGTFPSVSAGWKVINEDFMKNSKVFTDLKFRASYGLLGNSDIGNFKYLNNYSLGFPVVIGNDGVITNSFNIATKLANEAIQWENVTTTNIGVDLGFLKNALTVSLEYYSRQTKKMVYDVPLSPSAGQGVNFPFNIGQMSNKGFEFLVNYDGKASKDLTFNVGLNGSFNTNKLISLDPELGGILFDGDLNEVYGSTKLTKTEPGQPLGQFYGWVSEGIYNTDAEGALGPKVVGESTLYTPKAGDLKYKDINGDAKIDDSDRQYIGNPWPKLNYGITLGLQYKGFDLSALLVGIMGVDIYNAQESFNNTLYGDYNTTNDIFNTSDFGGNGIITNVPRSNYPINHPQFKGTDPNGNWSRVSSYHVKNGSYLRMKNLQLGYNIPKSILKYIKTSSARFFIMSDNLFTITKYNGFDPEIAGDVRARGIDSDGRYPTTRYLSMGLNLNF